MMGKPIREGKAALALREFRWAATRAAITREGSVSAAARALGVDRHMVRAWLGESFAVPTGGNEIAGAVRGERKRRVREAGGGAGGGEKRTAGVGGKNVQREKRWLPDVGIHHPPPSLVGAPAAKKRYELPGF